MWTASNLVTGPSMDGGKSCIPDLQSKEANGNPTTVRDNAAKGQLLYLTFFPLSDDSHTIEPDQDYPTPAFKFKEVSDIQIHRQHTVYEAELVGTILAAHLLRKEGTCREVEI